MMNLLLIGSGGREHALCWKLAQSPLVKTIYCAPGNPGMETLPKVCLSPIAADNLSELLSFAKSHQVDLTLVGPEKPLADGIVDLFQQNHQKIFGPTQAASALESSKNFSKEIMTQSKIPTANYVALHSQEEALNYLKTSTYPIVLKANGLAAGKGVSICKTHAEAKEFVSSSFQEKKFGAAGNKIVAEEFLEGEEVSFLVLTDGKAYLPLPSAQDHKRLQENEKGPNTGGMGAYSPAPIFTFSLQKQVETQVVQPLLKTMRERGTPFSGILYVGLMITSTGPKVLEFNVRFGDPETQAVLPRLETDLAQLCWEVAQGQLKTSSLSISSQPSLSVVLASEGYPDHPKKGAVIRGLETVSSDCLVFHAGTKKDQNHLITSGGRVFTLTALASNLEEAQQKVYDEANKIHFEGKIFRKDIGWRALKGGKLHEKVT